MPFGPRGIYRRIPHLTWQADEQVGKVLARVDSAARIVDLGAGGRRITPGTIAVDFVADGNTNVVGDVQRLPLADGCADLVYATGLLEHVVDERAVVAEIRRILKPGGLAHVEVPFLEQYHEDPIDVRRLTAPGLERLMRDCGFESVASGAHIGPTITMLNTVARWWALWFEGRSTPARAASFGCFTLLSVVFWPFKFLDALLIRKAGAHRLALGVYCTARKR